MKRILKYLAIILSIALVDQLTKSYLIYLLVGHVPLFENAFNLIPYPYIVKHVTDWFNIVFTWNPGTSFSMFRMLGEHLPIVIIVATLVIICLLVFYMFRKATKQELLPLFLILGGALGNIIDRIRFGAVVDFLDLHINKLHWPAFNVADICIVCGVCLYIIHLLSKKK